MPTNIVNVGMKSQIDDKIMREGNPNKSAKIIKIKYCLRIVGLFNSNSVVNYLVYFKEEHDGEPILGKCLQTFASSSGRSWYQHLHLIIQTRQEQASFKRRRQVLLFDKKVPMLWEVLMSNGSSSKNLRVGVCPQECLQVQEPFDFWLHLGCR